MIKRLGWTGDIACISVCFYKGLRWHLMPSRIREDNIKMDLKYMVLKGLGWINRTMNRNVGGFACAW